MWVLFPEQELTEEQVRRKLWRLPWRCLQPVLLGYLRIPISFNGCSKKKKRHPFHCRDPKLLSIFIWSIFIPRIGLTSSKNISLERTNERPLRSKQPPVNPWASEPVARGQMLRTGSSQDLKNRSEGGAKCDALTSQVYGLCLFLSAQISDTFPRRQGNYNVAYFSMTLMSTVHMDFVPSGLGRRVA